MLHAIWLCKGPTSWKTLVIHAATAWSVYCSFAWNIWFLSAVWGSQLLLYYSLVLLRKQLSYYQFYASDYFTVCACMPWPYKEFLRVFHPVSNYKSPRWLAWGYDCMYTSNSMLWIKPQVCGINYTRKSTTLYWLHESVHWESIERMACTWLELWESYSLWTKKAH